MATYVHLRSFGRYDEVLSAAADPIFDATLWLEASFGPPEPLTKGLGTFSNDLDTM